LVCKFTISDVFLSFPNIDRHYIVVPKNKREQRAISAQMKHESFKGTIFGFQRSVKNYGREHGMIFPIKPKPAVLISISQ